MRKIGGIALITALLARQAIAQDGAGELFDLSLDELLELRVDLTGSRLQRDPTRSSSPLVVYDRTLIDASGAQTIGEFLATLPVNGSVLNNNGSAGTAHGSGSVNLRNLGENRTLVLLNGRRLANGTATRGFRDFVDLSVLPLALIDRIEVLGAGASAIYGADAIAGVVNLISRGQLDGQRLLARHGRTGEGDGAQSNAAWLGGRHGEHWSLWGGLSWQESRPILVDDRDFSAVPLGALSSTTPQGRYVVPGFGTLTLRDGAAGTRREDFRPFDAQRDQHNPFANTYLRYPSRQSAAFAEAQLHVGELRWFGEVLIAQRESEQNFSPVPATIAGSAGFAMPADHPHNPFGIDLVGSGMNVARVFTPLGQRVNRQRVDFARLVLGVRGSWWRDWTWEIAANAAQNRGRFLIYNQLNRDHLALAIGPVERCVATPGCVAVPLFGSAERFTSAMVDWLRVNGRDRNRVEQRTLQLNTQGDLLMLAAGPLRLAAGLEFRDERGEDLPDPLISGEARFVSGAPTSGQVRDGTRGRYRVSEGFAEVDAPLWQSANGARLQGNLAVRHSHYDSFGGATTGRVGLWFAPSPQWTFRATAAQAFRAPSILELFEGGRTTNLPGIDPCAGGPPLPGCAGVPASYRQGGSQVVSLVSGNPDLQPETAEQFNLGARWQWHADWSIGVEAYRIRIDDLVLSFNSQQILDDCAYAARRCELIRRNPTTGSIVLLAVQRDNAGQRRVDGVDVELSGQWQAWTLRSQFAYLHRFDDRQQIATEANLLALAGRQLLRASFPRWRGLTTLGWQQGEWRVDGRWRYLHGMLEASDVPDIAAVHYLDLQLARQFGPHWRAHVGIDNLFDRRPPASRVNANINFDIATYEPRGRFWYAGIEWNW